MTFDDIIANLGAAAGHVLLADAYEKEKKRVAAAVARDARVWEHHAEERDRIGDLLALVTNMSPGEVLFIDDVDRWSRQVQDALRQAIVERVVEITIANKPYPIELPAIICIAATAKLSALPQRFREAFWVHIDCVLPAIETLEQVLERERAEKRAKRLKKRDP